MANRAITARTLADLLPHRTARLLTIPLGAVLIGGVAQFSLNTELSSEPITGTTFAVLVVAAALGMVRGSLAVLLYCIGGLLGVPWFPGASSEMASSSYGYVVGFVIASALVGWLAERGWTRNVIDTALAFLLGDVLLFTTGVGWFAISTENSWSTAVAVGMSPFLIGQVIAIALGAVLLPLAWRLLVPRVSDDDQPEAQDIDLRGHSQNLDATTHSDSEPVVDLRGQLPSSRHPELP